MKTPLVEYDRKGLIIDSEHVILFSASIHYPRCQPSDWEPLIQMAKEAGINCIETCNVLSCKISMGNNTSWIDVFWNQHEKERGVYDFSDRLDLFGFIKTISQAGLYALLRIGPYICAETHFGGFPHWLRDIDGNYRKSSNSVSFYLI